MKRFSCALLASVVCMGLDQAALADAPPNTRALLLATDDVYDCAEMPDGLSFARATSGGLVLGDRVLTSEDGLPDTRVVSVSLESGRAIGRTERGAFTVSLADFRVTRTSASAEPLRFEGLRFLGKAMVRRSHEGAHGTCMATNDGLYVQAKGESAPHRAKSVGTHGGASFVLPSSNVSALARAGESLFVGTFDSGLVRWDPARGVRPIDAKNANINALLWDETRSTLWVGTARGLVRCAQAANCERVGDGVGVHALELLEGGSVAAGGDGLLAFVRADGTVLRQVSRKEGAPFRAIWALGARGGSLYIGTTSGLYYTSARAMMREDFDYKTLRRVSMVSGDLPDDWVTAIAISGDLVHVGTYNAGLVSFRKDGDTLKREGRVDVGYVNPAGISVLPTGELAVATMRGLRVGKGESEGAYRTVSTLGTDVTQVLAAPNGHVWVATRRGVAEQRGL